MAITAPVKISDIQTELRDLGQASLTDLSNLAYIHTGDTKFTPPHKFSDFIGFEYNPVSTANVSVGYGVTDFTNAGGTMTLGLNNGVTYVQYQVSNAPSYQQISMSQLSSGYAVSTSSGNILTLTRNDMYNENADFRLYIEAAPGYEFYNATASSSYALSTTSLTLSSQALLIEATQNTIYASSGSVELHFGYRKIVTWTNKSLVYYIMDGTGTYGLDTDSGTLAILYQQGVYSSDFRIDSTAFENATQVEYKYGSTWGPANVEWLWGTSSGGSLIARFWDGEKFLQLSDAPFKYQSGSYWISGVEKTTSADWSNDNAGVYKDPFTWNVKYQSSNSFSNSIVAYYNMNSTETVWFTSFGATADFNYMKIFQAYSASGPWTLRSSYSAGQTSTSASINPSNGRYLKFETDVSLFGYREEVLKVYYNI
jgi:hypothetical protein